jgi:hypothetical protein
MDRHALVRDPRARKVDPRVRKAEACLWWFRRLAPHWLNVGFCPYGMGVVMERIVFMVRVSA